MTLNVDHIVHMIDVGIDDTADVTRIRIMVIGASNAISNTTYQLNRSGCETKRTYYIA